MGPVAGPHRPYGFPPAIDIPCRCFGAPEIACFGDLTDDRNPIHSDAGFAARTPFGRPIVYGFLFVMPIWPALTAALGPDALVGAEVRIRFLSPIFVGQTVTYAARLLDAGPDRATYEIAIGSGHGQVAALVTATVIAANTAAVARDQA